MPLDISLSDREVSVDPVASLFRVSAIVSDHVTRLRQVHVNRDVDLGQGVKGRVVAVDYKTITLRGANGERRTVPMTSKRAAILAHEPAPPSSTASSSSTSHPSSSSLKRASPRKQPHTPPHAGATTRK